MVSIATPYIILENGGGPTKSIHSRSSLIVEHLNWCQIKALTHVFFPVVRYVNHLISIFMNVNENFRNERKNHRKIKEFTYKITNSFNLTPMLVL